MEVQKRRQEKAKQRRDRYLRLHELEGMTVAEIARAEQVDKAVISRLIKKAKEKRKET